MLIASLSLWERWHAKRDGEGPSHPLSRELSQRESLCYGCVFLLHR